MFNTAENLQNIAMQPAVVVFLTYERICVARPDQRLGKNDCEKGPWKPSQIHLFSDKESGNYGGSPLAI